MSRRDDLCRLIARATSADESNGYLRQLADMKRTGRTTALDQWRAEIEEGLRTASAPMDELWAAACRELNDAEFERDYAEPQRKHLTELGRRHLEVVR